MRKQIVDKDTTKNILDDLLKRSPGHYDQYAERVQDILDQVREKGDQAMFDYTSRFDGCHHALLPRLRSRHSSQNRG